MRVRACTLHLASLSWCFACVHAYTPATFVRTCCDCAASAPSQYHVSHMQVINDGVSIARAIELADPVENAGAQLIKEVRALQPRIVCWLRVAAPHCVLAAAGGGRQCWQQRAAAGSHGVFGSGHQQMRPATAAPGSSSSSRQSNGSSLSGAKQGRAGQGRQQRQQQVAALAPVSR